METAGAVSSTAPGSCCHLSHSPKGKPTAGSGPTRRDGSGRGSSINKKVMFLGAAAEKTTGMCSYILSREWGVSTRLCKPQGRQEHAELLRIGLLIHQPHRGKKDVGLKQL